MRASSPRSPIIWASLIAILAGHAGPAAALTLDEAVQLVMSTNPEVQAQAKNRRATDYELAQARGLYWPQIDARFGIGPELTESASTDQYNSSLGEKVADHGRLLFRDDATLTLRQRIFDGGLADSEVLNQIARVKSQAARVQDTAQSKALDAVQAYISVVSTRIRIENALENIETHKELLALVKKQAEIGIGNQADVAQAESRLANAERLLAVLQGQAQSAAAAFEREIGVPPDELTAPDPIGLPIPETLELSIARGIDQNPRIQSSKHEIEAAEQQIDREASIFFPQVNLEMSGTASHNASGRAERTYSAGAQVVLSYNLYRGGADLNRVREFKEQKNLRIEDLRFQERVVTQEIRDAWAEREAQRQSFAALERQVAATIKTQDLYRQQFELGQRPLLDVLDAAADVFNAKDSLQATRYLEMFAAYRIVAAQGELVQFLGATMPIEATPEEVDEYPE